MKNNPSELKDGQIAVVDLKGDFLEVPGMSAAGDSDDDRFQWCFDVPQPTPLRFNPILPATDEDDV